MHLAGPAMGGLPQAQAQQKATTWAATDSPTLSLLSVKTGPPARVCATTGKESPVMRSPSHPLSAPRRRTDEARPGRLVSRRGRHTAATRSSPNCWCAPMSAAPATHLRRRRRRARAFPSSPPSQLACQALARRGRRAAARAEPPARREGAKGNDRGARVRATIRCSCRHRGPHRRVCGQPESMDMHMRRRASWAHLALSQRIASCRDAAGCLR